MKTPTTLGNIKIPQFVLDNVFNKYVNPENEVIYWRDCVLQEGMMEGTQGYIWVFSDGEMLHSYRSPESYTKVFTLPETP